SGYTADQRQQYGMVFRCGGASSALRSSQNSRKPCLLLSLPSVFRSIDGHLAALVRPLLKLEASDLRPAVLAMYLVLVRPARPGAVVEGGSAWQRLEHGERCAERACSARDVESVDYEQEVIPILRCAGFA